MNKLEEILKDILILIVIIQFCAIIYAVSLVIKDKYCNCKIDKKIEIKLNEKNE